MSETLKTGLVSITFRDLSPPGIVALVSEAGLDGIEWGGDIHVPPGNTANAREVGRLTREAGLMVAAYGSYFRVVEKDGALPDFEPVLDAAVHLGAPTIRVWAGQKPAADFSGEEFKQLVDRLVEVADRANQAGLRVALEFHEKTYTDSTESTLRLLEAVGSIDTLWQPPVGMSEDDCIEGLQKLLPWVSNVHMFHWAPQYQRQQLAEGRDRWLSYLRILSSVERRRFVLLEFVKDGKPDQFLQDAGVLQDLIGLASEPVR